jgi:hypothetical protein
VSVENLLVCTSEWNGSNRTKGLQVLTNAAQPLDIMETPRAKLDLESQLQDAMSEEVSFQSGPANFLLKRVVVARLSLEKGVKVSLITASLKCQ